MEILMLLAVILVIRLRKTSTLEQVDNDLVPIGENSGEAFDDTAFTEIYYKLKE